MKHAMELLKDGKIMFKDGDILQYTEHGKTYYIDLRTITNLDPIPDVVTPFGEDSSGYILYICPNCGERHSVHKSNVTRGKPIMTGCCKKGTHSNRHLFIDHKIVNVKSKKIILNY